jgi:hypothetical protein
MRASGGRRRGWGPRSRSRAPLTPVAARPPLSHGGERGTAPGPRIAVTSWKITRRSVGPRRDPRFAADFPLTRLQTVPPFPGPSPSGGKGARTSWLHRAISARSLVNAGAQCRWSTSGGAFPSFASPPGSIVTPPPCGEGPGEGVVRRWELGSVGPRRARGARPIAPRARAPPGGLPAWIVRDRDRRALTAVDTRQAAQCGRRWSRVCRLAGTLRSK